MGLTEYECPACGGIMEFNAKLQMLSCPYCDTKIRVEDYKAPSGGSGAENASEEASHSSAENATDGHTTSWSKEELDQMVVYSCNSCGGEIIASEKEGSLTCPFCSNNVVVKEKFQGDLRPDFVIPFKYTKEDAVNIYRKYVTKKLLLPGVFSEENHIDKIRGIYIPYWLFDGKITSDFKFSATKVKVWSDGKYNYTDTSFFDVEREGDESFEHIPSDASNEMPDDLMESIEPFNFGEAVPFNSGYLAGFMANRYDVSVKEAEPRIIQRIESTITSDIKGTLGSYATINEKSHHHRMDKLTHKYALYPVWLLNTTFKEKNYLFAMNGQTGKFVGNLPVSIPKAAILYGVSTLIFSLLAALVIFMFFL